MQRQLNLESVSVQIKFSDKMQEPYIVFSSNTNGCKVCVFKPDWDGLKALFDLILLIKNNNPTGRETHISINRNLWLVLQDYKENNYQVGIHTWKEGSIVKCNSMNLPWDTFCSLVNSSSSIDQYLQELSVKSPH